METDKAHTCSFPYITTERNDLISKDSDQSQGFISSRFVTISCVQIISRARRHLFWGKKTMVLIKRIYDAFK